MADDLQVLHSPQRLHAVEQTGLLDQPPNEAFDRLTRIAAAVVGAPSVTLSLIDAHSQFVLSSFGSENGPEEGRVPFSHSFCKHVVISGAPLVVDDARTHPVVKDSPAIEEYGVGSYCGVPLRDDAGNDLGALCVTDPQPHHWSQPEIQLLTELAQLVMTEVRLRQVAADLDEANRVLRDGNEALRDFISIASHDMQNPLAAVLGFSSLMRECWDQLSDDRKQEYIATIEQQTWFLTRLVDDLLTMSRLEAGAIAPSPVAVSVERLLGDVVRGMGVHAEGVTIEARTGLVALVDELHLRRIVTNLLSNAVKYGDPPIKVRAAAHDGRIQVMVSDQGPGIPEELLPRLFDKFARASQDGTPGREGSGLGLSIVKGLAEANSGSVKYQQDHKHGPCFVVTLPCA
ncbi:MAG: GAF domain-containing sensor histidine kinase [Actinomycetota bacterium]|nr:GAF domain-containing sensor histidine kinase [Actinomycetota bacterium]